jgi:hypothetical protein
VAALGKTGRSSFLQKPVPDVSVDRGLSGLVFSKRYDFFGVFLCFDNVDCAFIVSIKISEGNFRRSSRLIVQQPDEKFCIFTQGDSFSRFRRGRCRIDQVIREVGKRAFYPHDPLTVAATGIMRVSLGPQARRTK